MSYQKGSLRTDIDKFYKIHFGTTNPTFLRKLKFWLYHFGLHCVVIYRFGKWARNLKMRNKLFGVPVFIIQRFFNFYMRLMYHVEVDDADIEPGFYIGHIGTIFVGPSKIGKNFSIHHNVTIGIGHAQAAEGVPTIGDNVWIGAGAMISGAIKIGSNVTVANGCMLSRNIPDGALAVGNPGRVIMKEYDNNHLLSGEAIEKPADPKTDPPTVSDS
ncbi:MAG: serine acetyltransferase [candidate division Zixibacteria bacterium]|nr:serine acetyltransferase [candidate division Zixibacteria bacterium]